MIISDAMISQIFLKIGKSVINYSFLGKGEASIVYKVNTNDGVFALKTALYPERKGKILHEAKIRSFFIENGLDCIPPPIYTDELFFSNGAVIYDFVEGNKLDFFDLEIISQFALVTSKIHQVKFEIIQDGFSNIEKFSSSLEQAVHKIDLAYPHLLNTSLTLAFDSALKEFKDLLPLKKRHTTIAINAQLHGDLSDNFVIDSRQKIWLLDWENSEFGDVAEELCWFLSTNKASPEHRAIFFQEYQNHFHLAKRIPFEALYSVYFTGNLIFNICWGIDQLAMNIRQQLEPERKLRDLACTAKEWGESFSKTTSSSIVEGIELLTKQIS
ncbi:MAG: aminoglycoside phosphotransferase family protein [Candidatus Heimdallarchaeota archaeon]|nr:aminoglycoside phosphotransferase family protein [Candidatus Heimdallarchaeota archaeon]